MLRIQPLRAPRDENIYECVAENAEGEITVNAKLSIIRGESPHAPTSLSRGARLAFRAAPDGGLRLWTCVGRTENTQRRALEAPLIVTARKHARENVPV